MSGVSYLPVKGEYHDNFLTAQAAARGRLDREQQKSLFDRLDWLDACTAWHCATKRLCCCARMKATPMSGCR